MKQPFSFQTRQVAMNSRSGAQTDRFANLTDRGRIAPRFDDLLNVGKNPGLHIASRALFSRHIVTAFLMS